MTLRELWIMDTVALVLGFVLDLCFGDPIGQLHPVCRIGKVVTRLETFWYRPKESDGAKIKHGACLVISVVLVTFLMTFGILICLGQVHVALYLLGAVVLTDTTLAAKDLRKESMEVYRALPDLKPARARLSRIVGRDTEALDEAGIIRAAVETVAENTTDGVVAPLFYLALGGPALAMAYKAVNTMDSMIGYKNDRYLYFGRVAARLDDVAGFLPARIAGLFWILSAGLTGEDLSGAVRIWLRDRYRHESPNSAQTESACAGSLGIRLGGAASYFGKRKEKPGIGDDTRPPKPEDIKRANRMMLVSATLMLLVALAFRLGMCYVICRFG